MLRKLMSDAVSTNFPPTSASLISADRLVIMDTQVVMDWLVFNEPSLLPLIASVESRHLHWVATEAMRAELLHVIGRGVAARYAPDVSRIHSAFEAHCRLLPEPSLGIARPRCSDTDDQKFIDLGLSLAATQPTWLISRDRAVLKVAKRAGRLGLSILSPAAWLKLNTPA